MYREACSSVFAVTYKSMNDEGTWRLGLGYGVTWLNLIRGCEAHDIFEPTFWHNDETLMDKWFCTLSETGHVWAETQAIHVFVRGNDYAAYLS